MALGRMRGLSVVQESIPGAIDRTSVEAAIRLAAGRPDLVVVDRRVLRLLMGDLAGLIVLGTVESTSERMLGMLASGDDQPFVWDEPGRELCPK